MRQLLTVAVLVVLSASSPARADDPLPSWNDGPSKQAIVAFVAKVTKPEGRRLRRRARAHRRLRQRRHALGRAADVHPGRLRPRPRPGARAAAPGVEDQGAVPRRCSRTTRRALAAAGEKGLVELMVATHTGMTTDEFAAIVEDWIRDGAPPEDRPALHRDGVSADARAPRLPARERLQDVHRLGRRLEFMRPWTEKVYGIPPEQVDRKRRRAPLRDGGGKARAAEARRRSR